ncbi:ComEA family DNA-binding protein [Pseudoxanthomonas sp.]|jgi:competence protein ComEA|uniref:ComEA family DNA-binding protein n=1 Tax=Pseudoxanthomonas sp. TaxID=1871049 RepID=UPI003F80B9DB
MKSLTTVLKSVALSLVLALSAHAADKVNINTADAATLQTVLIGIGQAKAEAIIEYRKTNGPFKSAEELAMVKGIGLKTVERNRERIELRSSAEPVAKPAAAARPAPVTRR